jgi:transcriptional regulator with XRE-family HTH domain
VSYERNPRAARVHETFGMRVRRLREQHGWSARDLGRRSGVAGSTITRIESGHGTPLGYAVVVAETLGVPLAVMFGPVDCDRCDGAPPPGFRCTQCGIEGETPA